MPIRIQYRCRQCGETYSPWALHQEATREILDSEMGALRDAALWDKKEPFARIGIHSCNGKNDYGISDLIGMRCET